MGGGDAGGHAMGRPQDKVAHGSAQIDRRRRPHHHESEFVRRVIFLFKAEERQRVAHFGSRVAHARPNFEGRAAVPVSDVQAGSVDEQEQCDLCVSAERRFVKRSAQAAATGVGSRLGVCKCGPGSHRDLVHGGYYAPGVVELRCYVQDCVSEAVNFSDLGYAGIAKLLPADKQVRRGKPLARGLATLPEPPVPMPRHHPKLWVTGLCTRGFPRHNLR